MLCSVRPVNISRTALSELSGRLLMKFRGVSLVLQDQGDEEFCVAQTLAQLHWSGFCCACWASWCRTPCSTPRERVVENRQRAPSLACEAAARLFVCPQAWHRQVVCKGSKLTRLNSFWFQAGEAIEQAVDAQIFSSRYTLMTTKGCDSERMVCRTRAVRYWSFEISENVGRGT